MTELELTQLVHGYQAPEVTDLPLLGSDVSVEMTHQNVLMYEQAKLKANTIPTKALEWLRFQISAKNMLLSGYERRSIPSDNIYVLTTKAERLALQIILNNIELTPQNIVVAQLYYQHEFAMIIGNPTHKNMYTAKKQVDVYQKLVSTLGIWQSYFKIGLNNE